jgi:cysteine desulfuration protein SufE
MPPIPEKLSELLDVFSLIEDRQERIDALISTSERFRPVDESIARRPYPKENLTPNCESQAYVFTTPNDDGTLQYHFAVENPQGISAMAMAAILDETCSGAPPERVAEVNEDVIYDLFGRELSMGKSMGLMGMVQMVKAAAKRRINGG